MDVRDYFVDNLKKLMIINGKSQSDLVVDLNFRQNTVSNWMNGKMYPRAEAIQKLSEYFGVSISDLIGENKGGISSGVVRVNVYNKITSRGVTMKDVVGFIDVPSRMTKQGIISPTLQNELHDNETMIEKLNLEISKKKQTRQVDVDTDKLNFFLEQLYKKRNSKDGVEFIIKTFVKNVTLWDDKMTVHFDVTGKSPLDKTVEFNDLGVIKSASHLHQLTRYNNPIGYLRPKVYVYGYHVFITIHRITKKVA